MEIRVLGTGCTKCNKLENLVKEVTQEMGVEADIEHITDLKEIAQAGVLLTPGLVINGTLKLSGKVPSKKEINKIIAAELRK